ncbi:hypothetical protein D3C74_98250 [compost metagenome]
MEYLVENKDQTLFIDLLSDIICQYLESELPKMTEIPSDNVSINHQSKTEVA